MNPIRRLRCYDLCCGAGALSIGFHDAGAEILGGIDNDSDAVATATENHDVGTWNLLSIEELATSLKHRNGQIVWKANTILAGLPCQGYSAAGKRDPEDDRNFLYLRLLEIVERVKPDHVVFENVVGITTRANNHVIESLQRKLARLGYDVAVRILNAIEFGVPQRRKRVFLVAVRNGRAHWVFDCLRPTVGTRTVREALRGLPRNRENKNLSHVFMSHGPRVVEKLRKLKPGGPISYRRLEWSECSPTLVAGHRALPVHPSEPRAISVREAARIQGFEDSYIFCGSNSARIGQVANAVPPPIAEAIGRALRRYRHHGARLRGPLYQKLRRHDTPDLRRRFSSAFLSAKSRRFPWRDTKQPYRILVTELLLQRTNASLANQVWRDVLELIPNPLAAANADLRSLSALTARIGIRSRAWTIRELGAALKDRYNRRIPAQFDELMRLPGVGIYIASAVRAICFDEQDFPVDTNGFRFVARYFAVDTDRKKSEARQLREFMSPLMPKRRTRDYVYGFLDFAATICRPRFPVCSACPLSATCKKHGLDRPE